LLVTGEFDPGFRVVLRDQGTVPFGPQYPRRIQGGAPLPVQQAVNGCLLGDDVAAPVGSSAAYTRIRSWNW
jgi:hypothetical protein